MIFYVLNSDEKLVETIQSPDESGVAGITAIQGVVEEKLSTYELIEMVVPADSDGLEEIEEEMTIIFKDISGWREYIIYEIEDIDGKSLETTIRGELSSSELIDEVIERDIRGISNNPKRNLEEILSDTRWLAGQVDSSLYSQPLNIDTNYMNVLEALNEYAKRYSAEIRFRYEVDGNKVVRRYVDAYKQFGEYKGKIFEIDRDMTSVKRTVNTELIKTTIIPYSKELEVDPEDSENKETYRVDIKDIEWKKSNGDPVDKPLGQNYLVDPVALERWGKLNSDGTRRHKKIPMEFDLDNAEAIINMAWVQLGRYTQPRVSYEISAIDLYAMTGDEELKHEQILLGDTGGVKDYYFSNPLEVQTRLVEVKRDLFDPRNNDYVFGNPKTIFSANASVEVAEEMAKDMEDVITRIENAQISIDGKTKVFRGSEVPVNPEENDIWFRPHPSKQGHTQMMLFNGATWEIHVDSSDLEDAGRLTFGTIDGANINVINLIADNITGGQLKLENGIEITHRGIPILRVNNSGEVEMNISKVTINSLDIEEELERIQELEDGKNAYELAVENGFEGTIEEWLESLRGLQGLQGPEGKQGIPGKDGKDGVGIESTSLTYTLSTNNSTPPVSGWTTQVPTLIKGQYLWTRTVWKYTDNTSETGYSVSYIAKDGNSGKDGLPGKDGVGIENTIISYSSHTNGNTPPTTGWQTQVPNVSQGDFLWTRTVWEYSDSTSETGYSVSHIGEDGNDGQDGIPGKDGRDSYTHIAYATGTEGQSFNHSTFEQATHIGMYVSNNQASSTNWRDYEWTLIKGRDGKQGIQGPEGLGGITPYFHIAYANSADGTVGFSVYNSTDKEYIGQYTSYARTGKGRNLLFPSESPLMIDKTYVSFVPNLSEYLIKGQEYVYSFAVRADVDNYSDRIYLTDGITKQMDIYITNEWTRYSVPFVYDGSIHHGSGLPFFPQLYPNSEGADTIQLSHVKLEKGSEATDWGPAPEEVMEDSRNPRDYSWTKIKGEQGPQGVPGAPGKDGQPTYTWIRYADTSTGGGISNNPSGKEYIGLAHNKDTSVESNDPNDYTWSLIRGPKGEDGNRGVEGPKGKDGQTTYTWIKYSANANGSGLTDTPQVNTAYIGIATNKTTPDESNTPSDYTWSLFKGPKGEDGEQGPRGKEGPKGEDGQSQWTHIRYSANSNGSSMTVNPTTTTKYIGIAVTNSETAPAYTGFTWSKYIGEDGARGPQGVPGAPGKDGQPTYTWVKYAEDKDGGGMSDYPEGKRFIGLAFNKTTQTESTNANDYQWSEMPQNIEIGGRNLIPDSHFYSGQPNGWSPRYGPQEVVNHVLIKEFTSSMMASRIERVFEDLEIGQTYTLSVYVKSEVPLDWRSFVNAEDVIKTEHAKIDEWYVDHVTFTATDTSVTVRGYVSYAPIGSKVYIDWFKLEKGTIATDWTPAPEDIQEQIDSKASQDSLDEVSTKLSDFETVVASREEVGEITSALYDYIDDLYRNELNLETAREDIDRLLTRLPIIENNLGAWVERWNFLDTYVTLGNEGLLISEMNGSTGIRVSKDRIDFLDGSGEPVAYITNQVMRINRGIFVDSMQVGEHKVETIAGGHTIWQWMGG